MPEELQDVLNRATGSLPAVRWLEPEELRSRANRWRRRRTVAGVFATVLALAAGFGVARSVLLPGRSPVGSAATCPSGLVPADVRLPAPANTRVFIYNATNRDSLAGSVGTELTRRGLDVVGTGNAWGDAGSEEVVVLRYGPAAVGAAWVLRSYVRGLVRTDFDISRKGNTVDFVLGNGFRELASPTEVNRSIARLGPALAPPGTCPT